MQTTQCHRDRCVILAFILSLALILASASESKGYSALCAVGKNENVYVSEWINYHLCLGQSSRYKMIIMSCIHVQREVFISAALDSCGTKCTVSFAIFYNLSAQILVLGFG